MNTVQYSISIIFAWLMFSFVWAILGWLAPYSAWFDFVYRQIWVIASLTFLTLLLARIGYRIIKGREKKIGRKSVR